MVMRGKHDEVRLLLKGLTAALRERDAMLAEWQLPAATTGAAAAGAVHEMLRNEEQTLLSLCLYLFMEDEWRAIRPLRGAMAGAWWSRAKATAPRDWCRRTWSASSQHRAMRPPPGASPWPPLVALAQCCAYRVLNSSAAFLRCSRSGGVIPPTNQRWRPEWSHWPTMPGEVASWQSIHA